MTIVLIVDQAEEVLTLSPGEDGLRNPRTLFLGSCASFMHCGSVPV